ncbi:HEXXH motif-containing putative peptide modification protein [Streptomyces sp. NPDC001852]|uniref:aKG-HExxH-type peptide beta-hydroxylase n=1 Tax=unclassified Streptomyces TaxID=2593676 RepID=UPI00331F26DE
MTLVSVPREAFAELAGTRPRPAALTALAEGLHARRLLLLKSLLVRVERGGGTPRREFEADWALLEHAERTDARAVRAVVDYPMTGAWLAAALGTPDGPAFHRHLAQFRGVAAAAAVRAGHRIDLTLPHTTGFLVLPGLGVLHPPAGRAHLDGRTGSIRIPGGPGRGSAPPLYARAGRWAGPRRACRRGWSALGILPGGAVVLDDLHPQRVPAGGIGPAALPAAERPRSAHRLWARRWREAQAVLRATDPGRVAEIGAVLRAVVPLSSPPRGGPAMSATLQDAPGAMLSQLPADGTDLAEALVHEVHHTKLTTLHELVPLFRPGGPAVHRVGWRSDPRPVAGVLHGAYAHLALSDLWCRARTAAGTGRAWRRRAAEQYDQHRTHVGHALSILLESDELTAAGGEFVREMARSHARLGVASQEHE